MKVLFDHQNPFLLSHGGFAIQIQQTKTALEAIGVEVEYLRWWDEAQRGDIIHFFGRPPLLYVNFAQQKGVKVIMSQLLTGLGSRPAGARWVQKFVNRAADNLLPRSLALWLGWQVYRVVDISISLTEWEAHLMQDMFGVPAEKIRIVPNGVEDIFLQSRPATRGPWLVCTATIAARKRVVELAEAAVRSQTPVWIIGRPYAESDAYARRFAELARHNPKVIRYEGSVDNRAKLAQIYREARGFVLLSSMESQSLSALEAAACECPLLLSDLPWARTVFKDTVSYCPVTNDTAQTAAVLRRFHDAAPTLKAPARPASWVEVARQLQKIYTAAASTSR